MLDLKRLVAQQAQGNAQLKTLAHDEQTVIQNYAVVAAREIAKAGAQREQSASNIILNAFRSGMALGLSIEISARQVKARTQR